MKLNEIYGKDFARIYAQIAHDDTGARRKSSNAPYHVHPQGVSDIVDAYGGTEEECTAAELHDTVEDTPITVDALEELYGTSVAEIVSELTNDNSKIKKLTTIYGDKTKGKELYLDDKLENISLSALFVKLADNLYNLIDNPKPEQKARILHNVKHLKSNRTDLPKRHKELIDTILSYS
jgi:(p)ppGpp synthase/HD superfamily hydrolase